MSTKQYDLVIFIGRFQPFHIGHKQVINTALNISENVLVLVGSSWQPSTIKNPWSYNDRKAMIYKAMNIPDDSDVLSIVPLHDQLYNDQNWTSDVQGIVQQEMYDKNIDSKRIGIIGHSKDDTSYYLKMFPQWTLIEHEMVEIISATELRTLYFERKNMKFLQSLLPAPIFDELQTFTDTSQFRDLVAEYNYIQKYKSAWANAPYPPTFITADAVVVQSGHVLLVVRGAAPGRGLLALPGGFANQGETLEECAIRELREETKLKVPVPVIKGSIKDSKVFDAPNRSLRGRSITQAFFVVFPPGPLPAVKGGDDAMHAKWVPINEIDSFNMFEDHYDIVTFFVGKS